MPVSIRVFGPCLLSRRTHNEVLRRSMLAVTSPSERRTLQRLWRRLSQQQRDGR
jgi:hypothetical protein